MACIQSKPGVSQTSGSTAFTSRASSAFALMKSICARNWYDRSMSYTCGLTSSLNTVSMRITSRRSSASSSRMRLFASTTSAGSMNTVFPVALSSCTMPFMRRFTLGDTGIIRRPSRTVGAASLSTSPSRCAACSMVYNVREMLPSVFDSSWRMPASVIEAPSLIRPNLSMILSMRRIIAVNTGTPSASRASAG